MASIDKSELTQEDGRMKRTVKQLCVTNMTGPLLACFVVLSSLNTNVLCSYAVKVTLSVLVCPSTLGDMNICRWGAAVGALGPFLYICGGSDDASRLETVERFDPFTNVWVPSVPMSSSRNGVGVTAGNGRIYAIGTECVMLNSCEIVHFCC